MEGKDIKKQALIYTLSNILTALLPFILIPFLTRNLTTEEYGKIAMFYMFYTAIIPVIGLNAVGAANRYYFEATGENLTRYNNSCFIILLISSAIIFVLVWFLRYSIESLLVIQIEWVFSALLCAIANFVIQFLLGQWQMRDKAKQYALVQVTLSVLNALATVFFIYNMDMRAEGRIQGQVLAYFVLGFLCLGILFKCKYIGLNLGICKRNIIHALKYGVPLLPHHLGFFLLTAFDRWVVTENFGLEAAGAYLAAVQLSSCAAIVFDAINKAYNPWLFKKLNNITKNEKRILVNNTYLYFSMLLVLATVLYYCSPYLSLIVLGETFFESSKIIGLLLIGQVFGGMYAMVVNYLFYTKDTALLSLVSITSGVINVVLILFYFQGFGLKGIALAFVISKFSQFILTWALSAKKFPMPWFEIKGVKKL